MSWKTVIALSFAGMFATGCALEPSDSDAQALEELVVTDPNFSFATSRSVRLEVNPSTEIAGGHALEVSDDEGRRLLKGAVLGKSVVQLPLPTAQGRELRIRSGRSAAEQTVVVDADNRAVANF